MSAKLAISAKKYQYWLSAKLQKYIGNQNDEIASENDKYVLKG